MSYGLILFLSFIVPVIASFFPPVLFIRHIKALLLAALSVGAFFIVWDVIFTELGVWGFSKEHVSGITIINLPIEEVLFFFVIPFCSLFIYEILGKFTKILWSRSFTVLTQLLIAVIGLCLIFFSRGRLYTLVDGVVLIGSVLLFYVSKKVHIWGQFIVSFLIVLIPFLIVNGALTGFFTPGIEPIVWYDPKENLGIRIGTIPLEDVFYAFSLLLLNIIVFERFKNRSRNLN